MKKLLLPIALSISSSGAFAEDCGGKFSESGAFLMGKTALDQRKRTSGMAFAK
jgi:hypothetical protein